ncbi:restriction endonuclease subunit S, partial [Roseovarius tibetensis]|uniref:restriction endonuclease subunit S n=1 Tax=Roseovarius tibetensis TaxID=2685897 RepID=UPI003D7F5687
GSTNSSLGTSRRQAEKPVGPSWRLQLIHPEVLSFAIHSDPLIIRQIKSFNKGAIMDGLNLGIIRKLEINLPPMEEQLRFVAMLQKAQAIEASSETPDGSGEDLFQSLSQRAFRGEL